MKCFRISIVFFLLCLAPAVVLGSEGSSSRWDSLLEVTYRFSWYPHGDLQALVDGKGDEYGLSLEAYRDRLQEELGMPAGGGGRFDTATLKKGRPWKDYYLLSQAEFVLYLVSGNSLHLDNARTAMDILSGKEDQPDISFWRHFYAAHQALEQNDKRSFVRRVFELWQNVILKIEVDDLRMRDDIAKAGFVASLPHLYENVAHLVITQAIVEKEMSHLAPLGPVVLSLENKLKVENGYGKVVEAVAERMRGLNSDNNNLNFAVAFLEATANRNTFEAEKNPAMLVERFNRAEKFYRLALAWADTQKGRAAALTQYMGFLNYVTRRMADPEDPLARNPYFVVIPGTADGLLDQAVALYEELAQREIYQSRGVEEGFNRSANYVATMHKLWDSSAKLAIMLGSYYKNQESFQGRAVRFPAKSPFLKYCALFDKYARTDIDIVPDNAFFLVSFAAGELAGIYREIDEYSIDSRAGDLFFGYQLQAVETFPVDVLGILHLAYQANRDGHLESYFLHTAPIADRLQRTETVRRWLTGNRTEYDRILAAINTTVPQVMSNAYPLMNFMRDTGSTEDGMYRKTVAMNQVIFATTREHGPDLTESLLRAVGAADFSNGAVVLDDGLKERIPLQVADHVQGTLSDTSLYQYGKLKNELYASLTSPVHALLRALFYEIPYAQHQYPKALESALQP